MADSETDEGKQKENNTPPCTSGLRRKTEKQSTAREGKQTQGQSKPVAHPIHLYKQFDPPGNDQPINWLIE
jgi:hypothetical protein